MREVRERNQDTAYRTDDPAVVEAWEKYLHTTTEIKAKRDALAEAVGRNLMIRRSGLGHGSVVVGFERFDSDRDGDLLWHGGSLIVSSRRGANYGMVVPNRRRKAGKEFGKELNSLTIGSLTLPGMPTHHIYGDGSGFRTASPAVWDFEGAVYALWPCPTPPVKEPWESIPLSVYYAEQERYAATA